jgi:uncharacterized radical SAM superfamily Fe-S cluster-containing enzyme
MRKRCPDHGRFEAVVYGDADAYVSQAAMWNVKAQTLTEWLAIQAIDDQPIRCSRYLR